MSDPLTVDLNRGRGRWLNTSAQMCARGLKASPLPHLAPSYMGSCQNYGPFWGTLNNRCRIIIGAPKGTIILTTTHMLEAFPEELDPAQKHLGWT